MHRRNLEFSTQALNLQSIEHAISFRKGCYIGRGNRRTRQISARMKRAMFTFSRKLKIAVDILSEIEMQRWKTDGAKPAAY